MWVKEFFFPSKNILNASFRMWACVKCGKLFYIFGFSIFTRWAFSIDFNRLFRTKAWFGFREKFQMLGKIWRISLEFQILCALHRKWLQLSIQHFRLFNGENTSRMSIIFQMCNISYFIQNLFAFDPFIIKLKFSGNSFLIIFKSHTTNCTKSLYYVSDFLHLIRKMWKSSNFSLLCRGSVVFCHQSSFFIYYTKDSI